MLTLIFPKLIIIVSFFAAVGFAATSLAEDEVQALRDIAKTMGKTDWDFSVDPCTGENGWLNPNPSDGYNNTVTCNCTIPNDTFCHVVSIYKIAPSPNPESQRMGVGSSTAISFSLFSLSLLFSLIFLFHW